MPTPCPHCSEPITALTGFVTQEVLTTRLKAKTEENGKLSAALADAQKKLSGVDEQLAELGQLKGELEGIRTREARVGVLRTAGLDESLLDAVGVLFDSARASDEALTYDAWLGEGGAARAHPLLAPHFKAGGQTAAGQNAAAAGQQAAGAAGQQAAGGQAAGQNAAAGQAAAAQQRTAAHVGQTPAGPAGGPMTAAAAQAYFQSPAYTSLPAEKKREKIAEIKAQTVKPA